MDETMSLLDKIVSIGYTEEQAEEIINEADRILLTKSMDVTAKKFGESDVVKDISDCKVGDLVKTAYGHIVHIRRREGDTTFVHAKIYDHNTMVECQPSMKVVVVGFSAVRNPDKYFKKGELKNEKTMQTA